LIIHFSEGFGLKTGDAVRYRGIDVGRVEEVRLNAKSDGVDVTLRLESNARQLAREGSRFWIERPRFSLSRVSGLETVIGAKFVGVLPSSEPGRVTYEFDGVPMPPALPNAESDEITVQFLQGHGLAVGDPLKHRGIVVGEVTAVELNPNLTGVTVRLRLLESARHLARAGTQFWIERPKVSLTNSRGLDTIVGGRYLAVLPGPSDAEPQSEFEGLEIPAAEEERAEGGLEIVLASPRRHGLEIGAPVSYRGLAVGHVISVGLAADSSVVEARVYIQPSHKSLVRDNSRFWSMSGFDLDVGLTGVRLSAETLATIAAGGVAFATPNDPGKEVATGHRFSLHDKAEDSWSAWQPRMPLGNAAAPHLSLPQPLRAALSWKEKKFGFTRQRQREGWVLPLDNSRLLGPANLLTIPGVALEQSATLELDGRELALSTANARTFGDLALLTVPADIQLSSRWPREKMRVPQLPEDGVLVPGWQEPSSILAAAHLTAADGGWLVAAPVPIPADLHGATVVSSQDGHLLGMVVADNGRARIALLSEQGLKEVK
jgi:hypothetical protein